MKIMDRFSEYRIMWVFVFFDLPTSNKKDLKAYQNFHRFLLEDGFTMFQFSFYVRSCASCDNATVHTKRVKSHLPPHGKVGILRITDKQFADMEIFYAGKSEENNTGWHQLELF